MSDRGSGTLPTAATGRPLQTCTGSQSILTDLEAQNSPKGLYSMVFGPKSLNLQP